MSSSEEICYLAKWKASSISPDRSAALNTCNMTSLKFIQTLFIDENACKTLHGKLCFSMAEWVWQLYNKDVLWRRATKCYGIVSHLYPVSCLYSIPSNVTTISVDSRIKWFKSVNLRHGLSWVDCRELSSFLCYS